MSTEIALRASEPPRLGVLKLIANLLTRNAGRAEIAAMAAEELGNVVRLPVPLKRLYLVTHPDDLRRVMVLNNASYKKSFDYQILATVVGNGLLTTEGELWLRDRRLQQPSFRGEALERFYATIAGCAADLRASWQAGRTVSVDEEMAKYSLHVIGQRIFGLDVRADAAAIHHHLDVCQRQVLSRATSVVNFSRWFWTPAEARFRRSLSVVHGIVDRLIAERAALGPGEDLYTVLAERELAFGKEELRDQFLTLFFAGHETAAIALTWVFHCLSQHPEVAERLRDEVRRVVRGDVPTLDELDELPYTRQVVNEVLRLYPPVPFFGREALADDVLSGYPIPKGSTLILCPYATHRRSDLWTDPHRFDPDRFEGRSKRGIHFDFIPFAAGPRGCIGDQLAMLEILAAVATLSKVWRLVHTDPSPVRPVPLVSLRPGRPISMRIEAA